MILITGGGGLVGLHLARDLAEKGEEVLLLSWSHERYKTEPPPFLKQYWGSQVKEVFGDILEWPSLINLMARNPIDSIVHAAASWPDRPGATSLYNVLSVDVTGTLNILELARLYSLRRMTFVSSVGVYFGFEEEKAEYREDMALPSLPDRAGTRHTESVAATKKAGEQMCGLYASTYKMSIPVVRLARVYGPTAHWKANPMERLVVSAVEGTLADCSDTHGESLVCPIHAKDCGTALGLIHLKDELAHNIYNVADGNYVSYREVDSMVKEIIPEARSVLGTDKDLMKTALPFRPINIERIKSEGWEPEYKDLKKGIQAYVDYLRFARY